MKNCQTCGHQNETSMRFCVECGSVLGKGPQMVVPLKGQDSIRTDSFEQPTVVTASKNPKSNGVWKYFLLTIAGLLLLMVVGAAGVVAAIALSIYNAPEKRPVISRRESPKTTPQKTPQSTPTVRPRVTPTPVRTSGPPTKRRDYTILSNQNWQISDIRTVENESFRIRASGSYTLAGTGKRVSAKGIKGYRHRRIFKKFRTGALLMRTHFADGSHSNVQAVSSGQYWTNYPNERGMLEFIVNDKSLADNSGSLKIKFEMVDSKRS